LLIATINSRFGDGEPTCGQGLADGPDTGPCRGSVRGAMDADLFGNDRREDHCAKHLAQQVILYLVTSALAKRFITKPG
jgi:hypothetical protein